MFETTLCDSEVDNGGFGGKLRGEVRVAETGGHVEADLVIIVHVSISNLNQFVTTLNNDLLLKNGIEKRVNLIFDLFDKNGVTFHEREFEGILK